ncbi:RNA pseudouridine synthase 4, mitochondrial isoform X2 [Hevea brasiliensis]|uniref:RNA pseudouridine synthase 4, mitochondrial isoform X2 n=1 Tax=Hevea brasiliensis TaxID=3981 RepID=UPI0025EE4630|nr:RNA pseudouridine synthase 4, mitochondrial isoform X2 [Hevea brasiliensis]
MPESTLLRRFLLFQSAMLFCNRCSTRTSISAGHILRSLYTTTTHSSLKDQNYKDNVKKKGKWFTLPPYTSTISGSVLGKALSATTAAKVATETTALKWVLHCCPELPRSLVQKLFRLRQVRRESSNPGDQAEEQRLKRVAAKDLLDVGDRIVLPITVQALPFESEKQQYSYNEEEINFIRSLELYKDDAIIVVNKPPGMPVQGGIGIKRSLDELAASCLCYDYPESPRLVHRLDRDSSGILVMGRTPTSTTVLHSIFREKTFAASNDASNWDTGDRRRILQRKYWALVIGSPRHQKGLISASLGRVVVDNGKSDRITVVENAQNTSSQHAVTQYRLNAGYTWLELSPLTGRKHQLRVHCAEVLGTPIIGDYKYGWQAHRKWKHLPWSDLEKSSDEKVACTKIFPFGIDLESGSIFEKQPRLHLHCKQMVLPNVSQALQGVKMSSEYDFSDLESIELDAALPSYMQRSWDVLSSCSKN